MDYRGLSMNTSTRHHPSSQKQAAGPRYDAQAIWYGAGMAHRLSQGDNSNLATKQISAALYFGGCLWQRILRNSHQNDASITPQLAATVKMVSK